MLFSLLSPFFSPIVLEVGSRCRLKLGTHQRILQPGTCTKSFTFSFQSSLCTWEYKSSPSRERDPSFCLSLKMFGYNCQQIEKWAKHILCRILTSEKIFIINTEHRSAQQVISRIPFRGCLLSATLFIVKSISFLLPQFCSFIAGILWQEKCQVLH